MGGCLACGLGGRLCRHLAAGVAARRPEGQPRVLTMYPLRCADHAVKHGSAPGGGKAKKWLNSRATPWPNMCNGLWLGHHSWPVSHRVIGSTPPYAVCCDLPSAQAWC